VRNVDAASLAKDPSLVSNSYSRDCNAESRVTEEGTCSKWPLRMSRISTRCGIESARSACVRKTRSEMTRRLRPAICFPSKRAAATQTAGICNKRAARCLRCERLDINHSYRVYSLLSKMQPRAAFPRQSRKHSCTQGREGSREEHTRPRSRGHENPTPRAGVFRANYIV